MVRSGENVNIIEWDDMDKSSFYLYGFALSFSARCVIYPSQLIKTRLQGQTHGKTQYNGMFDAISKIYKAEGVRGYYKGLHLNLMQIPMAQLYLTVFEHTKQQMSKINPDGSIHFQHAVAGAFASATSQLIATPIDVVTQYQQVSGAGKNIEKNQHVTSKKTLRICKQLYRTDGLHGFYRGFGVATIAFSIHSALIWMIYYEALEFTSKIFNIKETKTDIGSKRAMQIIAAGILSSSFVNMVTLPLDTIRTRHQLQLKRKVSTHRQPSVVRTCKHLLADEGVKGLFRGWSPRLAQSFTTSGLLFLGYEYLKIKSFLKKDEKMS